MAKGNLQLNEASQSLTRTGEGSLVTATVTNSVGVNGTTLTSMTLNLAEAPVPDRRYAADFVSVVYKDDVVKLVFGQEKLGSSDVRSCVVIAFNTHDARFFLQSVRDMKNPSLDEVVVQSNITTIPAMRAVDVEPAQTIALSGNFIMAGCTGRSSCMDIYSVSAFAFANVQKTKKIPVDPVVRIDLSTAHIVALRDELARLSINFAA